MCTVLKIDSHQHFWKYDHDRYPWIDNSMQVIQKDFMPHDFAPLLKNKGFDASIAVEAHHSEEETEFLLNLAAKNEFIKGVVGWINLASKDVESRLEAFAEDPALKGLRHTVWDKKGEFLLEPSFTNGISKLEKFKLTYDLLVFESQLYSAVELAKCFPNQIFVLNHFGNPDFSVEPSSHWIAGIKKLAEQPNVLCKLSGFSFNRFSKSKNEGIHPFLDIVVEAFGVKRVMFGSNWPVCNVSASYNQVLQVIESYFNDFSEEEKQGVYGGNAARVYGME